MAIEDNTPTSILVFVTIGYYSEENMALFNQGVRETLDRDGAHIDAMYYCPHHPDAKIEKYRLDCDCRKPKPGMLIKAQHELNIDLKRSFMIGDKLTDIEAGRNARCKTIMVRTGYGAEELESNEIECDYVADDLYDAVQYILHLSREQ